MTNKEDLQRALADGDELGGSNLRGASGLLGTAARALSVFIPVYAIFYLVGGFGRLNIWFDEGVYLASFLGLVLVVTFLQVPARKGRTRGQAPWHDILLALAGAVSMAYVTFFFEAIRWHEAAPTALEVVLAVMAMLVVLEATRRLLGWTLVIFALAFIFHTKFTYLFPGLLGGRGYSLERIVGTLYIQKAGLFGLPLGIASGIILVYILFGQLLLIVGTGDWFIKLANSIAGAVRGGPAKVAVIASAFFGTVTGSPVVSSATVGVITIPLMKKIGYHPPFAGAVEAVAGTGGQFMPPIMGVVAFIIAEYLNISYAAVAMAALLMALLYFLGLYMQIDFRAATLGIKGIPGTDLPPLGRTLRQGSLHLLPLAVLVYFLFVAKFSPITSGLYASLSLVILAMLRKETRIGWRRAVAILENTTRGTLMIAVACATSGIIIGAVNLTGLGINLSQLLVDVSGSSVLILLVLTAVTSLVLGLGLPEIVCYIMLVILVAPALTGLGVLPIQAHLFIFYFGGLSTITPPFMPAVYVTSSIARSDPMKTGWQAMRLAAVAYFVPFMIMYSPGLLLIGNPATVALEAITAILGVIALAAGIEGYLLKRAAWPERLLLIGAGISLITPFWAFDLAGAAALAAITLWQYRIHKVAIVSQP